MRRYLVVADETVGGKRLLDEISARHAREPSRFMVLVPSTVPREGLTWTEAEARGLAQDRLDRVLRRLRELGVEGDGRVGDADPLLAIQDTFRAERFDEIILSAPSKRSGWMKPDLPRRIREAIGVSVTYLPGELERATREEALMRIPLFAGLPKRQVRAVARLSMVHSYREGTAIAEEGAADSDLYVILDGRVKVVRNDRPVGHMSVGEIFGEVSLLSPGPRTASVIAEAPSRCLRLSGRDLRTAFSDDPQLAARVLEAAGRRLRELSGSFVDLMLSLAPDAERLEQLAEAAHVSYCAAELAKGSTWGEPTDEYLLRHELLAPYAGRRRDPAPTSPSLVAFENLPERDKEQNRDLIRDIPAKLAVAGHVMRQAPPGGPVAQFSREEVELLAEQEHDRWVLLKLAQGWSFAPRRHDEGRRHPDLVPWRELGHDERIRRYGTESAARIGPGTLPEEEKEKDRLLIRRIGEILALTGHTAVKVEAPVE